MPATNRALLTPGDPGESAHYFKDQPPSWEILRNGLAVFAIVVIARFCLQHLLLWFQSPESAALIQQPACLVRQRSLPPPPSWVMSEKPRSAAVNETMKDQHVRFTEDEQMGPKPSLSIDPQWRSGVEAVPRRFITRLPPAPPLTPPELSTSVFTFDNRRQSLDNFINQPNPDYMSTSTAVPQSTSALPTTPRRRSYNKTYPISIPMPPNFSALGREAADLSMLSSSYPPTSPLLPPPPPEVHASKGDKTSPTRDVEVKGEIISSLDGDGAGWTRHTRVFGGGPCLACAAAGGDHGGGFYGSTVTPEEMR